MARTGDSRRYLVQLLERALSGRLVGPPSHELGTMAETVAGDVVIAHFDHELWAKRLPVGRTLCAPAAWSSWRIAGEARRCHELLQTLSEGGLFGIGEGGRKADMV